MFDGVFGLAVQVASVRYRMIGINWREREVLMAAYRMAINKIDEQSRCHDKRSLYQKPLYSVGDSNIVF